MPTAKRASMREGPLSALFRKTTEDAALTPGAGDAALAPVQQSLPIDAAPAAPLTAPEREAAPPAAAGTPATVATPADLDLSPEAPRRAEVPSPQERLRSAFSADIPASLMQPLTPPMPLAPTPLAPAPPTPAPASEVFPSSDDAGKPAAAPAPIGLPVIRVVGVGGAGVNAVNRMIETDIEGVEFVAINTDLQSLQTSAAQTTLHIGESLTRGMGSGADPDLGREAARADYDKIKALLRGSDMIFIAAGAGGGTGTGAAPVVAEIARDVGAVTVGIVTKPFQFEGTRRREAAERGIAALREEIDTLIVVPNNRLLTVLDRNTTMVEAFRVADDVLRQGVQGIADLVTLPGLINLDFADVRTIMSDAGDALLGIGMGSGENRALDAAAAAVASPLLETSMDGARSILLSITGGSDISLWEVNEAAKAVAEAAHPDANIIFGAMVDEKLGDDTVWITVVATGFGKPASPRVRQSSTGERGRPAPLSGGLPAGEPRVRRATEARRPVGGAADLDVPEFIPRR